MKDKILISNSDGTPVTTVGELREILAPFVDECEINSIQVSYIPTGEGDAKLELALVTG